MKEFFVCYQIYFRYNENCNINFACQDNTATKATHEDKEMKTVNIETGDEEKNTETVNEEENTGNIEIIIYVMICLFVVVFSCIIVFI